MDITRSMRVEVAIVGLALYGATLGFVLGLLVWLYSFRRCSELAHVRRSLPCFSPKNVFFFIITSFLLCRLAWFAVDAWSPEHISDYVLNRVAFGLFFTAFTLVIFFWADTLHAMRSMAERREGVYDSGFFRSWKARAAFVVVNGIIYLGQAAFIVVFIVVDNHEREGRHAYNVNILSVVAVFGVVCLAFLGYGIGLLVVTRRAMNTRRKLKFYLQTITITVVLVVCFSARFAMFLYRPIAGDYMDPWVFASLGYWLPELLPTVLMAIVLSLSLRRQIAIRYHAERLSTYSRLGSNKGLAEPLITRDSDDDTLADAALSASLDYDDYEDSRFAINSRP